MRYVSVLPVRLNEMGGPDSRSRDIWLRSHVQNSEPDVLSTIDALAIGGGEGA